MYRMFLGAILRQVAFTSLHSFDYRLVFMCFNENIWRYADIAKLPTGNPLIMDYARDLFEFEKSVKGHKYG